LLSKGDQLSFNGSHVYSVQGCNVFIWATVIFRFAGTGFEESGQEKGKTRWNLGSYFGKSWKIYRKGKPARCEFTILFLKM
jgi:hypothetical protein